MNLAGAVDALLEAPVAPSFSKLGYLARRRVEGWRDIADYDMRGRTVVVTGATSGLGRHAAGRFASLGAHVVLVGRSADKTAAVRDEIAATPAADGETAHVSTGIADMADLAAVRELAAGLAERHARIDALVHNAGALGATRTENLDGVEVTVASQVLGPFLMTCLLLPVLGEAAPGRVITVSSGGMYATGLTVRRLQMGLADYRGSEQYARAKRAQVTLNEMWAHRVPATRAVFHAMHPGWADTPGVEASLPTFRRVTGPLLRSAEQGADTMMWLAADGEALRTSGDFWHDRRRRSIHKLPSTRTTDTPQRRADLWNWCVEQTGAHIATIDDVDTAIPTGGPDR